MMDEKCGVEIPGIYDGVCYWSIPGYNWHRFKRGDPRRERLERWAGMTGVAIFDQPPDSIGREEER